MKRHIIDVMCVFRAHVRPHGKPRGRYEWPRFRVVGIWDAEAREYVFFVTNVPVSMLRAESIPEVYRLRWEVETFYKLGKSGLGLHELRSRKAHIVELMVRSALIRASIAMQAKLEAEKRLPIGVWMNPLQWLTVWRQVLPELVLRILHGRPHGGSIRWRLLARLAADPNRSRPPTRWRCMASTRMAATSSA